MRPTVRLVKKETSVIIKTAIAANYLEITVGDPVTHGEGRTRYTDFRVEMKTNMPVFKVNSFCLTLVTLALS
jgi:sorting nexin-3/12